MSPLDVPLALSPAGDGTRPSGGAPPHASGAADVLRELAVDATSGLTEDEVVRRRATHGPNSLAEPPRRPAWRRFADQFRSALVLILVGAAALAAIVGDPKDAVVVTIVLLINAVLGYAQESRAETAMAALRNMLVTQVRVRRGGRVEQVPAPELVPGDIVLLEAGDRVPADGRLLETVRVAVDESALTGESVPVEKDADALAAADADLGDRFNLVFMNTTLVCGRAEMVVTATGMETEMGRVAELINEAEETKTPLQVQLDRLGKRLALVALVAVAAVFGLRVAQGEDLATAALSAVALAVAAIPEGLPAVVTVTLAVGVNQMAIHRAIVKRLASVETLGSTTVICSDKTGTLTLNQMTATEIAAGDRRFLIAGEGYRPEGEVRASDGEPSPELPGLLLAAALCNDARVRGGELIGDPTEGALVVLAGKAGHDVERLREEHPRIGEVPFDSAVKLMATYHRIGDDVVLLVKGAPDVVIARAVDEAMEPGVTRELDGPALATLLDDNDRLAGKGLRVLALASRRLDPASVLDGHGRVAEPERWIDGLTVDALVGIVDPPRPEARDAIALCRSAGIDVKMITGDHVVTAKAIAAELGITGRAVTGAELAAMSDDELGEAIDEIGVCARVSPEHKVRVVRALQRRGHVVAMTGDGVNDAAALRNADIGVAMGITGTEVTKEAGDMVLADDNFATIVAAVERGRTIYGNIVKFVRFQLTTNIAAILTLLVSSLLGLPTPLAALQLLWVNIIADGPPAMSLGVDKPTGSVMHHRPRQAGEHILTGSRLARLVLTASVMMVGTLWVDSVARETVGEDVAKTMAFTTFVFFQLFNVFNARTERESIFSRYLFSNKYLWMAVGGVAFVQVLVVHWGPLQEVFGTTWLYAWEWVVCIGVASSVLVFEEGRKMLARAWAGEIGLRRREEVGS